MEVVEARNGLESYVYNVRNSLQDEKTQEKLGAEVCDEQLTKVKEVLDWMDSNPSGSKEDYDAKRKETEELFRPVFAKLYEAPEDKGPTVEEID